MIGLLFVLGVAAADQIHGVTVYEPLINLAIPYAPINIYSNNANPLGSNYNSAFSWESQYRPMPQGVRLSDVYDRPVVVLYPSGGKPSANLTAYIAQGGVASLADSPHTSAIHDELKSQQRNLSAIVFRPSAFRYTSELMRVGGRPVTKLAAPQGLKLVTLARLASSDLPLLLVGPKDEFESIDRIQQLRPVGEIKFAADSVKIECAYYTQC